MSALDRLRQIAKASTPGPWRAHPADPDGYNTATVHGPKAFVVADCPDGGMPDAEFIAQARATYTALLDVAEAAERIYRADERLDAEIVAALHRLRKAVTADE